MIIKREVIITPYQLSRTLHIYLPDDYENSYERYPVMYMYDGHNLFHDDEATYGKSWGLEEFMKSYDKQMIIVGIECNHEGNKRLEEFCPYDVKTPFSGQINGTGKVFHQWVFHELKPMIDHDYRTIPFRECTAVGGSSMGGLMALHAVICHNDIVSKAACLSPAVSFCMKNVIDDIKDMSPDTRVYMDIGSLEVKDPQKVMKRYARIQKKFDQFGVSSFARLVEGGKHNEETWQTSNPIYMDYLWKAK